MTNGYGKRKAVLKMRTIRGEHHITVNGDDGWIVFPSLKECLTFVDVVGNLLNIGQDYRKALGTYPVKSLVPKTVKEKKVTFTCSGECRAEEVAI